VQRPYNAVVLFAEHIIHRSTKHGIFVRHKIFNGVDYFLSLFIGQAGLRLQLFNQFRYLSLYIVLVESKHLL
jgi:hypothetical protein